jgi:peptide/nickel transport system ATP-binding protein
MTEHTLLEVKDLKVEIPTRRGVLTPVNEVSFNIGRGEIVGVVGESGAGKSITGSAIIGLLDRPARISGGSVTLQGEVISGLSEDQLRRVRGKRIGTVFQDPLTSLDPLMSIGDQLSETAMTHLAINREAAREKALQALIDVGIPAAESRLDAYPHEFSGGMRQRVVIALALIGEPDLIIADEPTTALDVSVQAQVLMLLKRLCRERNTGVMLITHDMGVIAETTDRVVVLYAGRVAEIGNTEQVLTSAKHPYTRGLVGATPNPANMDGDNARLNQIPGSMPGLLSLPTGCPFHPRCNEVMPVCKTEQPALTALGDNTIACHLATEASA